MKTTLKLLSLVTILILAGSTCARAEESNTTNDSWDLLLKDQPQTNDQSWEINPTEKDIGRAVIYDGNHGGPRSVYNGIREDGAITSFNRKYVFVRYKSQHPSQPGQATRREDLEWLLYKGE